MPGFNLSSTLTVQSSAASSKYRGDSECDRLPTCVIIDSQQKLQKNDPKLHFVDRIRRVFSESFVSNQGRAPCQAKCGEKPHFPPPSPQKASNEAKLPIESVTHNFISKLVINVFLSPHSVTKDCVVCSTNDIDNGVGSESMRPSEADSCHIESSFHSIIARPTPLLDKWGALHRQKEMRRRDLIRYSLSSRFHRCSARIKSSMRRKWSPANTSQIYGFKRVTSQMDTSLDVSVSEFLETDSIDESASKAASCSQDEEFLQQLRSSIGPVIKKLLIALLSRHIGESQEDYERAGLFYVHEICNKKNEFFGLARDWEYLELCASLDSDLLQEILHRSLSEARTDVEEYLKNVMSPPAAKEESTTKKSPAYRPHTWQLREGDAEREFLTMSTSLALESLEAWLNPWSDIGEIVSGQNGEVSLLTALDQSCASECASEETLSPPTRDNEDFERDMVNSCQSSDEKMQINSATQQRAPSSGPWADQSELYSDHNRSSTSQDSSKETEKVEVDIEISIDSEEANRFTWNADSEVNDESIKPKEQKDTGTRFDVGLQTESPKSRATEAQSLSQKLSDILKARKKLQQAKSEGLRSAEAVLRKAIRGEMIRNMVSRFDLISNINSAP